MVPRKRRKLPRAATLLLVTVGCAGIPAPASGPSRQYAAPASFVDMPAAEAAREQTADQQVVHALNRLAFGPRPGDIEAVRSMGVDAWIERQLHPVLIDDHRAVRFVDSAHARLKAGAARLARDYPPPQVVRIRMDSAGAMSRADSTRLRRSGLDARSLVSEVQAAKVARAVVSERQLQEVMVDFWENHFSVFVGKGPVRYYLPEYGRDVIRPHALGTFRELLGAVAKSPAMLLYLDNWQSAAEPGRPTLARPQGRDPRVAVMVPRVRRPTIDRAPTTGPAVVRPPANPPERPGAAPRPAAARRGLNENYARELLELHTLGVDGGYTQQDVIEVARAFTGWSVMDPRAGGAFVFRAQVHDAGAKRVLGVDLPARRGIEDGEAVLDILASHPSTARFIATKLARRFVSDDPPEELVDRAAETYLRTGGDIREVVRTIVTSPEFFSAAAYRAKVKSPFELVVSTMRALGAGPEAARPAAQMIAGLGQPLYGAQTPNGYPETGDQWINSGSILARINFGMAVGAGRASGLPLRRWPAGDSLARASRDAQVEGVVKLLLHGDVSPDTRAVLLAGENPLARRDMDDAPRRASGMGLVLGLALGSPEFQRR